MSASALELLAKFQELPPEDRYELSVEVMREMSDYGGISEEAMVEMTAELFREYDRAEAADGKATY